MTVPPADFLPAELHLRKVCGVIWCYTGDEARPPRPLAPVHEVGTPLLHGVGPAAVPGAAEPVRRALLPGPAVVLARGLRQGAPRRGDRAARRVRRAAADAALDDAPVPDRRRRARRRQRATPPFGYRDANWAEVIVGVDPDPANAEPDPRLDGRLLGRDPSRTRPAAPT